MFGQRASDLQQHWVLDIAYLAHDSFQMFFNYQRKKREKIKSWLNNRPEYPNTMTSL
jgi:hypothetical protein